MNGKREGDAMMMPGTGTGTGQSGVERVPTSDITFAGEIAGRRGGSSERIREGRRRRRRRKPVAVAAQWLSRFSPELGY